MSYTYVYSSPVRYTFRSIDGLLGSNWSFSLTMFIATSDGTEPVAPNDWVGYIRQNDWDTRIKSHIQGILS
jgi:hypothetical protein